MDVKRFVDELLSALAATRVFERVALQTEGPIASVSARTAARDLNGLINREIFALRGAGRGTHYLLRSGSQ